jgi:5'-3' exonuclease
MGIPFYFASLARNHKGIIEPVKKGMLEVDVFLIDCNCLIHRYLQDNNPIQSIIEALQYILETVCRAKQVIIAMDGLVPYGKIVQQRYRRMCIKEQGEFDRNQISPETPYMKELEAALIAKFPSALISGTNKEGEGEHKLILEVKKLPHTQRKTICVYGLDADLILIALQHHTLSNPYGMWLLRESGEFNDPKLKQAEFATLSIWKLLKELPIEIDQYICLSIMCFGNDFMPSLGMFSLREDGYSRALEIYQKCGNPDLKTTRGRNKFLKAAALEESNVLEKRIGLRKRPEEKAILGKSRDLVSRKYSLHVLDGVVDTKPVVEAYWKTFHWTLHYFQKSEPANWYWVYPYADAPLVSDIVLFEETTQCIRKPLNFTTTNQLQCIMPSTSLRTAKKRVLFPNELYSETRNPWMKKYDWEMKPRISLPWNPEYSLTTVEVI